MVQNWSSAESSTPVVGSAGRSIEGPNERDVRRVLTNDGALDAFAVEGAERRARGVESRQLRERVRSTHQEGAAFIDGLGLLKPPLGERSGLLPKTGAIELDHAVDEGRLSAD